MLEGLKPTVRKIDCKARTLLESLDKADAVILQAAYDNPDFSPEDISNQLADLGLRIGPHPIRRHRVKKCHCDKI